jgi:hypothetical protein
MVFPDFAQNVLSLLDPASSYLINGAANRFLSLATACGLFAFVKKESLKPNASREN